MCLTRTFQKVKTMNLLVQIRVRDAARRAFIAVDTDQRLRRAAVSASRPDRLFFDPGDMCYFWRDGVGWSTGQWPLWCLKLVKEHYYIDYGGRIFKQSAEQLSHVTERERMAQGGCARIPGSRSKLGSCK